MPDETGRPDPPVKQRRTFGDVFGALEGNGEGPFAGCVTSFDEWQDAMAFKARQAAQERKRLGLPPEVADPNDPMRRR